MAENISILAHDKCCGCKACGDVCPKSAITYVLDCEAFMYPSVGSACVDCGLCTKVCPSLNPADLEDSKQLFVGCLDKNKERRDKGSSGGIFGLLASEIIEEGGVVCGAAFDANLKLHHIIVDREMDVEPLKKSKYLQSDCQGVYQQIKMRLADGSKVMFVGTPCQCAALKRFLEGKPQGLTLVDFACHGVPSQDLFDRCIKYFERKRGCEVFSYSFRHKSKRYGSPQNFLLKYQVDGRFHTCGGAYYKEPFYCGFQKYMVLRPSCYSCKWARTERVSDITLADFWGIESVTDKWDRTDYPSLVLLNTEEGHSLFESIKNNIEYFETEKELAVRANGSLIGPTKLTEARRLFFEDLNTMPFDEVVTRHLKVGHVWMRDIYYAIPFAIRNRMLKLISDK